MHQSVADLMFHMCIKSFNACGILKCSSHYLISSVVLNFKKGNFSLKTTIMNSISGSDIGISPFILE